MNLPALEHPERYRGLFVVDLGDSCGVGYTAEEVAMLLESQQYAHAVVYRIAAARPDGTLELVGAPRERFAIETGLFFYRRTLEAARDDFDALRRLAEHAGLPCRAQLFLATLPEGSRLPFVAGLAYPAEFDPDISRWMLDQAVLPGEYADGGPGRLETIRRRAHVIETAQLPAAGGLEPRSREEVFAAVGRPVQRVA